jgi:GNAT superfamily N-acetyltransferase
MNLSVKAAATEEIVGWRDLYRQEMNCQIVYDSLHSRPGWTQPYILLVDGVTAGYGSVVLGGPWEGKPTLFEFYVLPDYRSRVFDLFGALLAASRATMIEAQTNDSLLSVMLHTFAHDIQSEKIIFRDQLTTAHARPGFIFRRAVPNDATRIFPHQFEPVGDWVVEVAGAIAATGGILFHYNRPYGDLYLEVAEPFRRRGLGSCLVQELKRVCYAQGSIPAARCGSTNVASRQTFQKAGFVPCGHILHGAVSG